MEDDNVVVRDELDRTIVECCRVEEKGLVRLGNRHRHLVHDTARDAQKLVLDPACGARDGDVGEVRACARLRCLQHRDDQRGGRGQAGSRRDGRDDRDIRTAGQQP